MARLINIDNGGTLTDICVWDGREITFTKTLTTPFDLSQCLFDGITKASADIYGAPDLPALLHSTKHIRYSTTQGTNALVERKGPEIGLIVDDPETVAEVRASAEEAELFDDLIGERTAVIDLTLDDEELGLQLVRHVNALTTAGAARLVVSAGGIDGAGERRVRRILLRKFPRHLLGSVPVLYSSELAADRNHVRRIWSGIINSFLHPTIERFLYNTEDRLREHRVKNPLLIYRNDGASSRVAKSVALKTYSSGPRGGLEATRALAQAYGLGHVLMIDVGGTTTDVGSVLDAQITIDRRGSVKGVPISFPMSNVHSSGVGGSSVIAVNDGVITVGPESVGAAPGPACFGFGGKEATITDVNLLLGVLDPTTYLDGGFTLDVERARAAVEMAVAEPLGLDVDEALIQMEQAYFEAVAASFAHLVEFQRATTVAAFGGAGPMSVCGAAEIAGVRSVVVPKLAAVFSAFGIGFSDISQTYEQALSDASSETAASGYATVLDRARRDMFQEGHELDDCETVALLVVEDADGRVLSEVDYQPGDAPDLVPGSRASLFVTVTHALPHVSIDVDPQLTPSAPVASGSRRVRSGNDRVDDVPVFVLADQSAGAAGAGPAIVEGPYFTTRVLAGWSFEVSSAGDLLLQRQS